MNATPQGRLMRLPAIPLRELALIALLAVGVALAFPLLKTLLSEPWVPFSDLDTVVSEEEAKALVREGAARRALEELERDHRKGR